MCKLLDILKSVMLNVDYKTVNIEQGRLTFMGSGLLSGAMFNRIIN
jgi:hypothetical protein